MKYLVRKDNLRRFRFNKIECERLRYKSLSRNYVLPSSIRFFYKIKLSCILKNSSSVRIRNRCKVVGKAQSVYRFSKLSRSTLRSYLGLDFLLGLRKSGW